MFRIGEFSRLAMVSVRMLRHYDEIGLLTPNTVDPYTGYRYYSAGQLGTVSRIQLLREMGVSLGAVSYTHLFSHETCSVSLQYILL